LKTFLKKVWKRHHFGWYSSVLIQCLWSTDWISSLYLVADVVLPLTCYATWDCWRSGSSGWRVVFVHHISKQHIFWIKIISARFLLLV